MKTICSLFLVGALMVPGLLVAQQLEAIPEDVVQKMAPALVAEAAKLDQQKVKIEADVEKANGFHVPKKMGALLIPQKDLKESEELAAKFKADPGASLGYLFLYHIVPIADRKRIDTSKMRTVTITDNEGMEHKVHVVALAVRQPSEDDYRLHVYGADAKPLVDAKFTQATESGSGAATVELKNANHETREGDVVVTVFGKYQATFKAAYVE